MSGVDPWSLASMVKEHFLGGQLPFLPELLPEIEEEAEEDEEDKADPCRLQTLLQTRGSLAVEIHPVDGSTRN